MIRVLPIKLVLAPATAAVVLAADFWSDLGGHVGFALNLVAIAILVGGFVVVGAQRSTIATKNEIIGDLKTERDIERDRLERLGGELREALVREKELGTVLDEAKRQILQLEARPDYVSLIEELRAGREAAVGDLGARIEALSEVVRSLPRGA